MTWLISDANVIIDLEVGGILDRMFRLPEIFAVPNILYSEELEARHPHLPALGLVILDVREQYVMEAYRMGEVYKKTGYNDLLALALAKQEHCPLITGDAKLREAASMEKVDVRGTLWVVERMFDERVLDCKGVEESYEKMRQDTRRLPWNDVARQVKRFKS